MAWAYVGSADLGNQGGAAGAWTSSSTYTVTGGTTALLRATIWGSGAVGNETVSGGTVKWGGSGGQTMTLVDKVFATNGRWNYEYFVLNPTAGSGSIYINPTGTADYLGAEVAEYSGVKQSAQPDQHATGTSSANDASASVTPTNTGDLIGVSGYDNSTASAGTGNTSRVQAAAFKNSYIGDSASGTVTGGSAYTAHVAGASSLATSIVIVSYTLDAGGGGFTPLFRKTLSGIGSHVGGRRPHWEGQPYARRDRIYVPARLGA